MAAKLYDLKAVIATVGVVTMGGYGEEGGISIEPMADIAEALVGATGETVISRLNNNDAICELTMLETSKSYRDIAAQMQLQIATPFTLLPLPFLMRDLINGDIVASVGAVYLTRPTMSKTRRVGERVFRLHLPGAAARSFYGLRNAI